MKRMGLAVAGLCLVFLWALPVMGGTIIVGQPPDSGTGNCYPFGCAYNAEYQQVYTSSLFSGSIEITGLEFFNTQYNSGATSMNSGTWTISLSTTSADWNTISPNFASNIGANNTQVFSGNLFQPWSFGDTLTINFTTDFNYNPADGNLLMDVVGTNVNDNNGAIYFDTNGYNNGGFNGNTIFGRDYCPNGTACNPGTVNNGYGLVTGFITGTTGTPEPATLVLFGTGLLLFGAFVRRKVTC